MGDIALSMWQYYAATLNSTWLKESGLPVLAATAEFFAGWAEANADGSYSLKKTQGKCETTVNPPTPPQRSTMNVLEDTDGVLQL